MEYKWYDYETESGNKLMFPRIHFRNMNKVKAIMDFMVTFKEEKKLQEKFDRYSHSFFRKQRMDKDYINELIHSQNSYRQLAAVYFARRNMKKDVFLAFIEENKHLLKKSVVDHSLVRRSIAGKKSPQK